MRQPEVPRGAHSRSWSPIVAGLLSIPTGATAAGRPTGPPDAGVGAWFGGSVNQLNDGVNGGQAEITARETFLGRRYDIIDRFYGYNAAVPTSLESWDVSMGRIPMITWGAPEDTIRLASGVDDSWLIAQAEPVRRLRIADLPSLLPRDGRRLPADLRSLGAGLHRRLAPRPRHLRPTRRDERRMDLVSDRLEVRDRIVRPQTYYPGDAYVDWIAATDTAGTR